MLENFKVLLTRLCFLVVLSVLSLALTAQTVTVSGYVKDAVSQEDLPFSYVETNLPGVGAVANDYGFYSISIPADSAVSLYFTYSGYAPLKRVIQSKENVTFNAYLSPSDQKLTEATVTAERKTQAEKEVTSTKMSSINVQAKQIKRLPSIGGEVDVLKVVQLLPGVSKGVEGGTGMFVRGGDADQNLVILDEAIVYNVGHLFGFFSVFNPDAIRDLTMTKGAFPAYYGGRLSSVLDIHMKDGNKKKFAVNGGIGLLSSRITVEGPIINEKASFLVSARRTYIDQVFGAFGQNIPYYFYDLNGKLNYTVSNKDRLYFSTYFGDDVLKAEEEVQDDSTGQESVFGFGFNLGNMTQTLRWNHLFKENLFSNISLIHTQFRYEVQGKFLNNNLLISSQIRDFGVKADLHHYKSNSEKLRYGLHIINHNFKPNVISTSGEISDFLKSQQGDLLSTLEMAGHIHYHKELDSLTAIDAGFRLSTSAVKNAFYIGPEPRIAIKRSVSKRAALKFSYSRMYQYMHRVSSSTVALPTDLWYPITSNIKPQNADQIALGYHQYIRKIKALFSMEVYHKWMRNLIEYKEGTNLVLNNNFEEALIQGNGNAYGLEWLLKKDEGKLNGWIGYTLSWSKREFEELNNGKTFYSRFDRRHDISVVMNYDINVRHSLAVVWVFASGSRFTPMVGQYFLPNASLSGVEIIPIFSDRNAVSMNSSHRLDINWIIKSRQKDRRFNYEWFIGAYNVYNRASPFTIRIVPDEKNGGYKYQQPGLFGFIPSIAFNFSF